MTFFADLEPYGDPQLLAVGWLEAGHDYQSGVVSETLFSKLVQLFADPWQPVATAGFHQCSLCQFASGPRTLTFQGQTVSLGAANLFVPGDGVIYVAPSVMLHYIDAHSYAPPQDFQAAAMACPGSRGMAYMMALRANGPPDLAMLLTGGDKMMRRSPTPRSARALDCPE